MNPSNPTSAEVKQIEALFFRQMQQLTKHATQSTNARGSVSARLRSFDFQCSDQWI